MPDLDDLNHTLRGLADEGERFAHPLSPDDVRRLGDSRRIRRRLSVTAGALAVALVALAGALGVNNLLSTPQPLSTPSIAVPSSPTPSATREASKTSTPTPTRARTSAQQPTRTTASSSPSSAQPTRSAEPAGGTLSESNLPRSQDMAWHSLGDWKTTSTWSGSGQATVNRCQATTFEKLGASQVFVREFSMGSDYASAVIMQFDDPASMDAALEGIKYWMTSCPERLSKQGIKGATSSSHQVSNSESFSELSFPDPDNADSGIFQATGVATDTDRLRAAFVTMETHGQDNNWDYEPNGPVGAMHPMFRTLPRVSDRLS